jgi:hypothetical protein
MDNFTRGQVAEAAAGIGAYASKEVAFDSGIKSGKLSTAATVTTALDGDNNDMSFTADTAGLAGNDISVEYRDPGEASQALAATLTDKDILVSLATDAGTAAAGTISGTGVFTHGELIKIGDVTYEMVDALTTSPRACPYEVLIGANLAASLDNLKSAINATAGAGTTYGTGTVAHPDVTAETNTNTSQEVVARDTKASYNSIATTTTAANATWGAETLEGGVDPAITSTAAEIKTAIEAVTEAAALVNIANKAANDGSGVVTAMAKTYLTGGSDGTVPLFEVTGTVLLKLFATCSENLAGDTATLEVGTALSSAALIAQTTATNIDANEIWHDATPDASIEASTVLTEKIVNQDVLAKVGTAAISDGTLTFHAMWKPISRDGNVVAV